MSIRYLPFFIWSLCFGVFAQEVPRDSLQRLLEGTISDTTQVSVLIEIAKTYGDENTLRADSLLQAALAVSEKIEQDDDKAKAFETVGHYLLGANKYDSAIAYYNRALSIHKENNGIKALARHHDNLGTAYFYKSDYNQTLYHFLERLVYCEQLADSTCISAASNNAGLVLINLGRYEDAISYTLRSLKIDEALAYPQGILSSQMSLGNINFYLKNYDKAIDYYLGIVATCEQMGNQELRISYAYNNIASIYFEQQKFEKAVAYYKKSLTLEKEFGNKNGIALKYNNLGSSYKELGDFDTAAFYFDKALNIRQELGDLYGISSTQSNMGQLCLAINKPAQALKLYLSALAYAEDAGSLEASKIAHEGTAKSYKKLGRYHLSLKHYEHFLALNDSVLSAEKAKTIAELEERFNSEKRESEIALLKKDKELQQAQLVQQQANLRQGRIQRTLLFIGLAVLIIVAMLIVYSYKQKLAAKELIQRNQLETEKIRSRFFASISHEFRTPLTLISAPVHQLQKRFSGDWQTQRALGLIDQNANRLLSLINQILNLSKLEEGKLHLQVAEDDIISWLSIISASFTSLADSKNITFGQKFPSVGITSFFDKEKVEQIVSNLLSNAMKFTPNGGTVNFLVTQTDDYLNIEVSNTGAPISPMDQERIFERFYQTSPQHHVQGTGIGLALVKELTELHHGSIKVYSNDDLTTFSLAIPLDDAAYEHDFKIDPEDALAKKANAPATNPAAFSKKPLPPSNAPILLLAEDHIDLRRYIGTQLGDFYTVKEVQNGLLALKMAIQEVPDLIITDLMMPEMDGESLLEKLRDDPRTQHIPVIMLTARTEQESKLNTIGKGADHYLTKPFDIDELKVRIKSLLEQRKRIRDHHKSEFFTNPKADAIMSSDDRFLQQIGKILSKNLDNSSFSVDEFADAMGMSRVQLYRKMKATIGYSVSEFIRQYRLKKAFEYLENGKGTVSEIAYDVGFSNLSYFTKAFKEVYHLKPSELLHKMN